MSVANDIAASYRGPGRVVASILARGAHEPRALAFLMGACVLVFIAQWPRLAREAHLEGTELNPMLGGALMAWLFLAPLMFYAIAAVTQGVARLIGRPTGGYGARIALFWALLATTPLLLLWGLIAGFIGPGPGLQLVGLVWLGCFFWFWLRGLMVAAGKGATPA